MGWFHHLQRAAPTGLLRYWLQRLRKLELCAQEVRFKRELTEWTQLAFATPEWEPWRVQSSFRHTGQLKDAQLLGAERQNLLWINGVLPFFLAFARQRQEVALEQLLYRILMVLPPEPENRHTRFLRKRLFGLSAPEFALHSCGARQGLLQIARDYCHNFYQGCQQCELLDLLRP